jgi:hypothetical protein
VIAAARARSPASSAASWAASRCRPASVSSARSSVERRDSRSCSGVQPSARLNTSRSCSLEMSPRRYAATAACEVSAWSRSSLTAGPDRSTGDLVSHLGRLPGDPLAAAGLVGTAARPELGVRGPASSAAWVAPADGGRVSRRSTRPAAARTRPCGGPGDPDPRAGRARSGAGRSGRRNPAPRPPGRTAWPRWPAPRTPPGTRTGGPGRSRGLRTPAPRRRARHSSAGHSWAGSAAAGTARGRGTRTPTRRSRCRHGPAGSGRAVAIRRCRRSTGRQRGRRARVAATCARPVRGRCCGPPRCRLGGRPPASGRSGARWAVGAAPERPRGRGSGRGRAGGGGQRGAGRRRRRRRPRRVTTTL